MAGNSMEDAFSFFFVHTTCTILTNGNPKFKNRKTQTPLTVHDNKTKWLCHSNRLTHWLKVHAYIGKNFCSGILVFIISALKVQPWLKPEIPVMSERPSYFFYWLPPPCHNSWVPPFFHSASSLWLIDLLPHSCLTEESPGARKKEVRRWAEESSSDMAGPHNTQWIPGQPSDWPLHGPVTWRIKKRDEHAKNTIRAINTNMWF